MLSKRAAGVKGKSPGPVGHAPRGIWANGAFAFKPVRHWISRLELLRISKSEIMPTADLCRKERMPESSEFLLTSEQRARWMRFEPAQLLKRFFFCERSLLISEASWIPAIASLEIKTGLARFLWQGAETAHPLRNRVF